MFCRCGLVFGLHDSDGKAYDASGPTLARGRLRCKKFEHHPLPLPRCGPGCQNGGKCWDEKETR